MRYVKGICACAISTCTNANMLAYTRVSIFIKIQVLLNFTSAVTLVFANILDFLGK